VFILADDNKVDRTSSPNFIVSLFRTTTSQNFTSPFFKVFLSSRASSKLVAMELSHVFGTVPLVAKACPKCVGGDYSVGVPVVPSPILIKQHKTWCSVAKCNKCNFRWYVCRTCTFIKSVLGTIRKLNSHAAKYHSQGRR
jgi:hypothetical protein